MGNTAPKNWPISLDEIKKDDRGPDPKALTRNRQLKKTVTKKAAAKKSTRENQPAKSMIEWYR